MGAIVLCFVELFNPESTEPRATCLAEFHIPRNRDLLAALGWRTPEGQKPFMQPRGVPPRPCFEFTNEYEEGEDLVTWMTAKETSTLYLHWKIRQKTNSPKFLQFELMVDMLLAAKPPKPYQIRVVWNIS
ncbi:MAG: hypothetical protein GWN86_00615 [Desulfobacterales bacterium]|nr:hypothetical protein [Desulfobacterales bacterium]